jgi:MYXO-CTERM domain-containing protein
MLRFAIGITAFLATTGTAVAGVVVTPGPEAGAGIASMVALGLGLAWLRRRKIR